jgi:predicted metal-binding membrane protein
MAVPTTQGRVALAAVLTALTALAWWTLWIGESAGLAHHAMHAGHATPAIFISGWTIMTIAMMLPTSAPLILMFYRMKDGRAGPVTLLVIGYLSVWLAFGVIVYFLQLALAGFVEGAIASAGILLIAGLYQFSPWKYACLDKCRSPMGFLMAHWKGNAFRLGAEHGAFCVGCCWSLMLVMFAVGTESLAWMLLLGVVMAAEKNLPWGRRLAAPIGVVLIVGAVLMFASARAS